MVYLLCFDEPLHHARHYLGASSNLSKRIESHRKGRGARLPAAFKRLGIGFRVVRTWQGDYSFERELKKRKNNKKLCPYCRGEHVC